jgi:hypothetical protein
VGYTIKLSLAAELDVIETLNYYAKVSDKIKTDFMESLDLKIMDIIKNPKIFQNKYKNIRVAFLGNFPFGIHFVFEKENIYIQRVLHTSRSFR